MAISIRKIALLLCCFMLLLSMAAGAYAKDPVTVIKPQIYAAQSVNQGKIIDLVKHNFNVGTENAKYREAKVKLVFADNQLDHLVVYLLRNSEYIFDTAKIDVNSDYSVKNLVKNYVEVEKDYTQFDKNYANYAPKYGDEQIEAVFATAVDDIDTAVAGVNKAARIATAAGYKVKVLMGSEASVAAYKYWMKQPNLKIFGNIGHGSTSGIMLSDGTLSYRDFNAMGRGALNGKVLYFNSCQVFNDPLKKSIITAAGAQKFIGGKINLLIGPSEEVFKAFFAKTLSQGQKMTPSLSAAERETGYPEPGAHGIGGNGSEYIRTPANLH